MSAKSNLQIFVVEDNRIYNRLVCEYLKKENFVHVKSFLAGKECLKAIADGDSPDIVIQDYFLDDIDGLTVLKRVKKMSPKSEFVFLTGNESMEVAVNTIKYGAYDYIIKDELAFKKVISKIDKISKLIELQKRNRIIKKAMVLSVFVLIAIVILALLHMILGSSR